MMADQRPDCASPRPMAFTVDFGPTEKKEHQKLGLRDNIGRFAPKFKNRVQSAVVPLPASSNKDQEKEVILVDEENNIKAEHAKGGQADLAREDVSDAGTYTIDEDEEESKVEEANEAEAGSKNTSSISREEEIERTFGLPKVDSDVSSRSDWVSAWAASNTFASDNPIQEEDDIDLDGPEEERSSSSQRRRLPPTPQHRQQNGYHQNKVCPISIFSALTPTPPLETHFSYY